MTQMKLGNAWVADVANPKSHEVDVDHMFMRLETDRRFSGHAQAYTIAAHQELVGKLASNANETPEVIEWALHHDCHEYVTGDIATPVKRQLGDRIIMLETAWDRAIAGALCIAYPTEATRQRVKIYDMQAVCIEWYFKMGEDDHRDFPRLNPNLVPEGWL